MLKSLRRTRSRKPAMIPAAWRPVLADPRAAESLLDQQFWCFGRDIVLSPRNSLMEYGFARHPKPRGRQDGSCYAQRTRQGTVLALWGFGVYFAQGSGILLMRRTFCPLVSDTALNPTGVWLPGDLAVRPATAADAAFALPLLGRLCRWFGQYETWILSQRDKGYGRLSLEGWSKVAMPRSKMAAAWDALALEFEQQIEAPSFTAEPAA